VTQRKDPFVPDDRGEKFEPYIPPTQNIPEISLRALILGIVLSVVFGVANVYMGLQYGIIVSASIPATVISMVVLRTRLCGGNVTPLETNIVQTIGSAGESLATGIVFTIPVFFIWSAQAQLGADVPDHAISKILIFWLSMLGGSLGILILIPLRKYLVEKEHGQLKFPEGTACARIIIVGDKGGSFGRTAVLGLGLGASYKALMSLGRLWSEFPQHNFTGFLNGGTIGVHAAPSLMGVGYIIGARTSALTLSGAVIGYLALAPLLAFIGEQIPGFIIGPGTIPLNEMDAAALRDSYIKYLGIGAIAFGGAVALLKCLPGTIRSFTAGIMPMIRRGIPGRQSLPRTDRDLSMATVLFGVLIIIIATLFLPGSGLPFVGALIAVLFGFFSCSYPPGSSV